MKSVFSKKSSVNSYYIDFNKRLSMKACMGMFQDITNDHCTKLKIDRWSLLKSSNAYWVTTKVKVKIADMPVLDDKLKVSTWTIAPTAVKFERDCTIVGKTGNVKIKSEWAAIDATTHKPRLAKTLSYPLKLKNKTERAIDQKFENFVYKTEQSNFVYSRTIFNGEIDVNNHVNNCFYHRFILECFSSQFLTENKLTDYEVHFVNESKEFDTLDFYKLSLDQNSYYVEAKNGDKIIIKAKLTFAKN